MASLKFGADLASWRMPLRPALFAAAELGVEGVVLDARGEVQPELFSQTAVRQLRKLLEDLNLRVVALRFASRRGYATSEGLERRVQATRQALELAYQLGTHQLLGSIGPIPAEGTDARRLLVEVLSDLAAYGHRVGALLATETGSESGASLAKLLAELPEGSLGVDFNPAQLVVAGHSPQEALASLAGAVVHVGVQDAVAPQGASRGVAVSVGQGSVDFPTLMGMLDERAYRGYFTIVATEPESAIRQSGAALRFLRSL